jgi:mono/diheme cytochrome c family protein
MQNRQLIFRFLGSRRTAVALILMAGGAGIQAEKPASQGAKQQAAVAGLPAPAQASSGAVVEGAAFLKRYCVTCHNQKLKTAGLTLETIDLSDSYAKTPAPRRPRNELAQILLKGEETLT